MVSYSKFKNACPIFESQRQMTYHSTEALVNDRKFDTAIRLSQVKNFITRLETDKLTQDDSILTDYMTRHSIDPFDVKIDNAVYSRWLQWVLVTREPPRRWNKDDCGTIDKIWTLVKDNIIIQNGYMTNTSTLPDHDILKRTLESAINSVAPDNIVKKLVIAATKLAVMIEKIGLLQGVRKHNKSDEEYRHECSKVNYWSDEALQLKVGWSGRLCLITLFNKQTYVMPRPYLLMFHNKVCDLISVLICTKVGSLGVMDGNVYTATIELVKEMCKLNIRHQEKFYTIAKSLEALVTAESLRRVDAWDNKEFYISLVEELYMSCGFDYEMSELKRILLSVDIATMHELACLSKIVGHPLVNMASGVKTLYDKVTERYTLDRITLTKCECHIKINYIRNSILRDRKWPPCFLTDPKVHPAIHHAWARNLDPYSLQIKEQYGTPSVLDFQFVELLPNLKFSELENTIPYLKDKTISVLRSRVIAKYLSDQVDTYDDPIRDRDKWTDTRLLLYYLTNTKKALDHTGYLHKYSQSADLSDLIDYLAIRCVPKEKELKIDPRFFGCKTYEERFRSLAQEKNAMKFLELYSDEQAMTLSELELARRLVAFRRLSLAYKDHYIMYIVVDASSWNNHFRRETVDDIMIHTLDNVFDVNIFGKTHQAFQNTLVYIPDEDVTYLWDGQDGGIEGLNQDTWVITYLAQIKTALDPLNLKYHALCKGDDLRIAICVPKNTMSAEQLPTFKNDVMTRVSQTAKQLGHKIKIEESYGSLRYFAFSKETSIGNIMLPQTLRKIQKVHGYNNAFLPYIDDMIASTYSNAHSACKVSAAVLPAELTGLFWCYYYMTQHPVYIDLSHDEYLALSFVPSLAGGFPIIYHHNMYVRAESDLLSPFVGLIQYLRQVNPILAEYMMKFCILPIQPPKTLERVYRDPYAIGTLMPMLPSSLLRNFIEPMLAKVTKNEDVLNLLRAAKSVSSTEFVKCLDSSNILPARVFAALYSSCPKGVLAELLAKFETARSILQLLIIGSNQQHARRILRRLLKQDLKLQEWRKNVIKGKIRGHDYSYLIDDVSCPGAIANTIRELSWGKKVETVTMPPLQHQVYLTTPDVGAYDVHAVESHFTFRLSESNETICEDRRPHYSNGPHAPFIGYTTRTGTIEPSMSFVEKDVLLIKLRNIIELASWTNKQGECQYTGKHLVSNVYQLIEVLVKQYTDIELKTFSPFVGQRRSGTVQHHIRCPGYKESIVPNTLLNPYTHIQGESDTNLFVNKIAGAHYKINFLHIYCYTVAALFAPWEIYRTPIVEKEVWCVNSKCQDCLTPINETPIVIDDSILQSIDFSGLKVTKLHEDAMEIIALSLDAHKDRVFLAPSEDMELPLSSSVEGVLQEIMETQYRARTALIDRYTQHTMTSEARNILSSFAVKDKRREIGWTEMKRLRSKELLSSLMNMIYYMIFKYIKWDGSDKLSTHLGLIPSHELPWYEIIVLLTSAGKMPDLARELQRRLNVPIVSSFNNPEITTLVFGYHAIVHHEYFLNRIPLVILTNYDIPQINMHISRQLVALARIVYSLEFTPYMPRTSERKPKTMDEARSMYTEDQYKMLIAALLYWCIPFNDEERICVDHQNIGSAELKLHDILEVDLDESLISLQAITPDTVADHPNNFVKYLLRRYKLNLTLLDELIDLYHEVSMAFLLTVVERFTIALTMTTLSDCVGKIREVNPEQDDHELDVQPVTRQNVVPFHVRVPTTSSRIQKVPDIPIEGWINDPQHVAWADFPEIKEPLRHIEYMSRPYGNSNCSMTTLLYILKLLDLVKGKVLESINCVCVGDGIGGMATVLTKVAPGSSIFYSTLHTEVGITFKPVDLMTSAEENNCVLNMETIRTGMTDLSQAHVIEYYKTFLAAVHILTCDVEIRTWSIKVFEIYKNVCDLYLSVRSMNGLLILKINHDYADEIIWTLHVLSNYCEFIYLVHPPTIRCHKISYVVAWGAKSVYTSTLPKYPLRKESVLLMASYKRFRDGRLASHNQKVNEGLEDRPRINPILSVPIRLRVHMPLLFLSLLTHQVGIYIDRDVIMNLPYETDIDLGYISSLCRALINSSCIGSYLVNYETHLRENRSLVFKNKPYDLNTRAHRVYIVQQCMKIKGVLVCLHYYASNQGLIQTQLQIKSEYLAYYDNLDRRDMYINEPECHFHQAIVDNGTNVSYYAHMIKGYNVGLTFLAFCRTAMVNERQNTTELQALYVEHETDEYAPEE